MSDMKKTRELINTQREYIDFLSKHLENHEVFMANRGMTTSKEDIVRGKGLRTKIKKLTKLLGL